MTPFETMSRNATLIAKALTAFAAQGEAETITAVNAYDKWGLVLNADQGFIVEDDAFLAVRTDKRIEIYSMDEFGAEAITIDPANGQTFLF